MAADDAAVVVTLRANLKDYETALKNAVRMTERAAKSAEAAVSGVGKNAKPDFTPVNDNFQKSANQLANDARIMQFQLNDIFSGLATGQGVRAVQQQMGQIAQQLGGGGMRQAGNILKTALVGMINPINASVVAFGLLATVAASYFQSSEDAAKELDKALKAELDTLNKLREAQGLKPVERGRDQIDMFIAMRDATKAADEAADRLDEKLDEISNTILSMPADAFEGQTATINQLDSALTQLEGSLRTTEDLMDFSRALEAIEKQGNLPEDIQALVKEIIDLASQGALTARNLDQLRDAMEGVSKAEQQATEAVKRFADGLQKMGDIAKEQVSDTQRLLDIYNQIIGQARTMGQVNAANAAFLDASQRIENERVLATPSAGLEYLKSKAANPQIAESLDRLTDAMVTGLVKLFQTLPESARITSGVRTYAEQAKLRADYEAGRGGLAAPPGHSRHEFGKAVDIGAGVDMATLKQAVDATKELETLKGKAYAVDKVHVQLRGTLRDAEEQAANDAQKNIEDQIKATEKRTESYDDLIAKSKEATELLTLEQQEIAKGSTIKEDENYQLIRTRTEQELLNAARREGIELTAKERSEIAAAADAQARAEVALAKTRRSNQDAQKDLQKLEQERLQQIQQINQAASQAVGGFVSDLMNGVDAGEAFNNMLKNIIGSLAQMAVQSLFSSTFGGGAGGGGLIGSLLGIAHGGGTVGLMHHREKRMIPPQVWAGAPRFQSGGVVGLRPGEVPIIAHRGEVVVPSSKVMGSGARAAPTTVSTSLGDVNIDMSGSGMVAANGDDAREFGRNVQKLIQLEMVHQSRPGGLLRKVPG